VRADIVSHRSEAVGDEEDHHERLTLRRNERDTLRNHPADGIVVHEAMSVEQAEAWDQMALLEADD